MENTKENLKTEALASSVQTLKFKISSFNKKSPMNYDLTLWYNLERLPWTISNRSW